MNSKKIQVRTYFKWTIRGQKSACACFRNDKEAKAFEELFNIKPTFIGETLL